MSFPSDKAVFDIEEIDDSTFEEFTQSDFKIVSLEQRVHNLEVLNRDLISRIESLERVLNLDSKYNKVYTSESFPDDWSLRTEADYVNFAKKKIAHLRNNFEWRSCFAAYNFLELDDRVKSNIDFILTKGPLDISKIVNGISKEILGEEVLSKYLVGVNGEPVKKVKSRYGHDSRPILPLEQENKLRTFFSLVDKIFISAQGWNVLIRKPLNQMGREFNCGKRKILPKNNQEKQAMFMHSFLSQANSLPHQKKQAIAAPAKPKSPSKVISKEPSLNVAIPRSTSDLLSTRCLPTFSPRTGPYSPANQNSDINKPPEIKLTPTKNRKPKSSFPSSYEAYTRSYC